MTDDEPIDYAHTEHAEQRREAKALALAKHLYATGVRPGEVPLVDAQRRAVERAAGVAKCSGETWARALGKLAQRVAWDARQAAAAPPAPPAPAVDVEPEPAAVADPEPEPAGTPAEPPAVDEPATLTVVPPVAAACSALIGPNTPCGLTTNVQFFLPGHRCPVHTPAAYAGIPEAVPDPTRTLVALRRAAGINTAPLPPPTASAAIDRAAVGSGKRRASAANQRAAHAQRKALRRAG